MSPPTRTTALRLLDSPTPADLPEFDTFAGVPPLAPSPMATDAPDVHLMLVDGNRLTARCSLWWTSAPPYGSHRIGLIGHYEAEHEAGGRAVLSAAGQHLREQGCTLAVGPMDGATWRSYRFVMEPVTRPPFFMEPQHPPAYPHHFAAAGFRVTECYRSTFVPTLAGALPPPVPGVTTRPLDAGDFGDELLRLHELATASFGGNVLYTPVPRRTFVEQYAGLRPLLHAELIRIAEQDGRPVGFCFAAPDHQQARRGEAIDTVVVKTLAVYPTMRGRGLGGRLVAEVHAAARGLDYRHAIHALMHEANASNRISDHYGETMRHYALFATEL